MNLIEKFIEALRGSQKIFRILRNNTEILIRCPICGDSLKDLNHAHFYIRIPSNDGEPFLCYCQKCNYGGIFDLKLLRKVIKGETTDFISEFNQYQNRAKRIVTKKTNFFKSRNLINYNKQDPVKLDYINKRMGLKLDYDELDKMKICLNILDLMEDNDIDLKNHNMKTLENLAQNFLGFISMDNTFLVMRYIGTEKIKYRYTNYNLYGYDTSIDGNKFYIIPNKINLLNSKFKIIITEGIFDLLGVYYHIKNQELKDNMLYIAVCGIGYYKILDFIVNLGIIDADIEIFADNDQNMRKVLQEVRKNPFLNRMKFTIYQNTLEKDFGVTKDRIKIKSFVLN